MKQNIPHPIAKIVPKKHSIHGHTRVDNYSWLRNGEYDDAIKYLETENLRAKRAMEHTKKLRDELYKELKGRIMESDIAVPEKLGGYYYFACTEEGKQYPIFCRKRIDRSHYGEEILLDLNELATGHSFLGISVYKVSPNHQYLAYSINTTGNEVYTLRIKDINSGELLEDCISNVYNGVEWANDNKTLFYNVLDKSGRPYKIFRHELGAYSSSDVEVCHESDEGFHLYVSKTRSQKYMLVTSAGITTTEIKYLPADNTAADLVTISPRKEDVEYYIDHHKDKFIILTNENAQNFKLMEAPTDNPVKENWKEIIPTKETVKLEGMEAFKDHLMIYERENGQKRMFVMNPESKERNYVKFREPVYWFWPGRNDDYNTNIFRFNYMSFVTPKCVFDYNMDTKEFDLLKQDTVRGGYNQSKYQCERIFVKAPDGAEVPLSIVRRKGVLKDGSHPVLLYAYGAYGDNVEPSFSLTRLSLLDRGFIYAVAHVRGGGEMGIHWYEQGKLLNKMNSFTDFIACAEFLINNKYTTSDKLVTYGESAGGLLMGAVVNMRPDLFKVVVAKNPFVDVVNSMLDSTIPLTVIEYKEWGDPNIKEYYEVMKSYSPYDNVEAKEYPHILVLAGLNDPRVKYWEPAKWVAKLRAMKTDNNHLLLVTNMGAGHSGASGRYDSLKETAFEYAFILDLIK